jgi:hypothetical protein
MFSIGCCLLNLNPSSCFTSKGNHKEHSVFVDYLLRLLAAFLRGLLIIVTPSPSSSHNGRDTAAHIIERKVQSIR